MHTNAKTKNFKHMVDALQVILSKQKSLIQEVSELQIYYKRLSLFIFFIRYPMCCFYYFIPPLISVIMSCRLVVYRLLTIWCTSYVALMAIGAFSTEVWVCINSHRQSSTVSWSNATDRMAGVMIIGRHLMWNMIYCKAIWTSPKRMEKWSEFVHDDWGVNSTICCTDEPLFASGPARATAAP